MSHFLKSILVISLVLFSPHGFADELKSGTCETSIECSVTQGNTTTTVTTNNSLNDGTVIRRPSSGNTTTTTTTSTSNGNYGSAGTAGSGAYSQAQDAKNQANMTMIAAFAMAAIMAAMCKPPTNVTPCILAPIAAAAGIMAAMKKNEAQKVMDSIGEQVVTIDDDTRTEDSSTTTEGDNADATVAAIKADLAKKGYKMNTDGSTTLPNGSTVAADLNQASLQAAGLSPAQINDLQNGLDKMKKDIAAKASEDAGAAAVADGTASGMDGTGGGGASGSGNDLSVAGAGVEAERSGNRDPAAWSGFFKQYGDSQIGVAQSDIFLMVEKRVENERKTMGH